MEKKLYTTPELVTLGKVEDLTKGNQMWGYDDMVFVATPFGTASIPGRDGSSTDGSG